MSSRILPGLTPDTQAFWTGGSEGILNIYRCVSCSRYLHPPRPICSACRSLEVGPVAVSGIGHVQTFTINHYAWLPLMKVPFVLAVVELVEQRGLWLWTNLINCEPDAVRIGMEVTVQFEHHEDIWLPMFEPVAAP